MLRTAQSARVRSGRQAGERFPPALDLLPDFEGNDYSLGVVYMQRDRLDEEILHFEEGPAP